MDIRIMWCTWIFIIAAVIDVCGACNFGSGCKFPCNCAAGTTCDSTTGCNDGCSAGWSGDGCLTQDNIARGKEADQSYTYDAAYRANNAVDGDPSVNDEQMCSIIAHDTSAPSIWWRVTFDRIYRVSRITLFVIPLKEYGKNVSFHVSSGPVGSQSMIECGRKTLYPDSAGASVIRPPDTCLGRSLTIYKHNTRPKDAFYLCEVQVTGHLYSECDASCGSSVSDLTSCNAEFGCIENCDKGKDQTSFCAEDCDRRYGRNCQHSCGQCKDNKPCSPHNGSCPMGCQDWYINDKCKKYIDEPGEVDGLDVSATADSLHVTWTPGQYDTGEQRYYGYRVTYVRRGYFDNKDVILNNTETVSHNEFTIRDLLHNTLYDVTVYPFRYHGNAHDERADTETKLIMTACIDPEPVQISKYTVTWPWNGTVETVGLNIQPSTSSGCDELTEVLLQWGEYSKVISETDTVVNLQLYEARTYAVTVQVTNNKDLTATSNTVIVTVTDPEKPSTSTPQAQTGNVALYAAIPTVLAITFIILVVALVVLRKRRSRKPEAENGNIQTSVALPSRDNATHTIPLLELPAKKPKTADPDLNRSHESLDMMEGMDPEGEECIYENTSLVEKKIKLSELNDYIIAMNSDPAGGFNEEYKILPKGHLAMCEAAQLKVNVPKNRYKNIKAYDHTRVVLKDYEDTDYINANFITGYGNRQKKYIATQGPKPITIPDFWNMVWQEDVSTIVMLTPIMENLKKQCELYWPDREDGQVTYGTFNVVLKSEVVTAYYRHRTFKLTKKKKSKIIHQLHFLAWPDKDRPEHIYSTLDLVWRVNSTLNVNRRSPIVVHCSAGIGRTGTYIALDYLLEQVTQESLVDITSCVHLLRTQRTSLVQTLSQYIFLYEAALHYHMFGQTAVTLAEYREHHMQPPTSLSTVQRNQFWALDNTRPTQRNDADGLKPENKAKNRSLNVIPDDQCRPYLVTLPAGANNYINAIFLDSHEKRDSVLVTQIPLQNTINDFWSLVLDQYCNVILVLDSLEENQSTPEYWPAAGSSVVYGKVVVSVTERKTLCKDTTAIYMTITKNNKTHADSIVLIQYTGWPISVENWTPEQCAEVLMMVHHVQGEHSKYKADGKLLVQCLDGAKKSGLLCAFLIVLDRIKVYQEVDISTATQMVVARRPASIQAEEDYLILHKLTSQHIQGFNTYANFQ